MSESEKGNSAQYLWKIGPKWFRFSRSQIRMGENDRVGTDLLYMDRWLFEFGKRRRSIRLHIIYREDTDNCLHDHPWYFWAFVLWGGYIEEVPAYQGTAMQRAYPELSAWHAANGFPLRRLVAVSPFRLHYRPIDYKHRIIKLMKKFSITLAYAGPLNQHWGFYTNKGKEDWENFVNEPATKRALWCDTR